MRNQRNRDSRERALLALQLLSDRSRRISQTLLHVHPSCATPLALTEIRCPDEQRDFVGLKDSYGWLSKRRDVAQQTNGL